jgi:hypothetical protein
MKSIVALIAIVAVANAGVVLEDGYVGSWFDTVTVEGTTDLAAPDADNFVYTGLDDNTLGMVNISDSYYGWSFSVDFDVTEGTDSDAVVSCDMSYTLWDDTGMMALNMFTCSCDPYVFYDADCYIWYGAPPGVYTAEFTIMDWIGNWQTYTSADGVGLLDITVDNTQVDTTAPVITDMEPTAAVSLTITGSNQDATTAGAFVLFSVTAHDNEGTDPWASGVMSGGVTLTDSNDETMFLPLGVEDSGTTDTDGNYVKVYGYSIQFYNWADADTWTVESFDAVDYAGNWATPGAAGFDIDLATDVAVDTAGKPPQCDTFDVGIDSYFSYTSSDYDTVDSSLNSPESYYLTDYIYLNSECNAEYSGDNFAGAIFASPQVMLEGATMAMSLWAQTSTGVLPPEQLVIGDYDDDDNIYYYNYPGAYLGGIGDASYWYDTWGVRNGYPVGDYTLDRFFTVTETGAVQVYDVALGSASSVVPSVLVVAVALVAAFLRL